MKPLEWTDRQLPDDEERFADAGFRGGRLVAYQDTQGHFRAGFNAGTALLINADDLETAKAQAEVAFREWWREVGRALGELE